MTVVGSRFDSFLPYIANVDDRLFLYTDNYR